MSKEEVEEKIGQGEPYVIRMLIPHGQTEFKDIIHGKVVFNHSVIDDQVLMKSDGYPTYHLANVVDDYQMKISHVIRGEVIFYLSYIHIGMAFLYTQAFTALQDVQNHSTRVCTSALAA